MHSIVVMQKLAAQLGQQAGASDRNFTLWMSWLVEKVDYCFQQLATVTAAAPYVEMLDALWQCFGVMLTDALDHIKNRTNRTKRCVMCLYCPWPSMPVYTVMPSVLCNETPFAAMCSQAHACTTATWYSDIAQHSSTILQQSNSSLLLLQAGRASSVQANMACKAW